MRFDLIIYLIFGGTLGVLARLLIMRKVQYKLGFYVDNILMVNLISSFLTGIYIALNISNYKIFLSLSTGFLGCLSTFSSFVLHLFLLIKKRKYIKFFFYYSSTLIFSSLLVFLGYFITKIIFNWKSQNYSLFFSFLIVL